MALPPSIATAITRFDIAAQNYAADHPDDPRQRTAIIHQYQTARENLERAIEKVTK